MSWDAIRAGQGGRAPTNAKCANIPQRNGGLTWKSPSPPHRHHDVRVSYPKRAGGEPYSAGEWSGGALTPECALDCLSLGRAVARPRRHSGSANSVLPWSATSPITDVQHSACGVRKVADMRHYLFVTLRKREIASRRSPRNLLKDMGAYRGWAQTDASSPGIERAAN